jgi:DNA-binding CsgD family transcriptional regulator/photosystem II stability/assembly factor-like uncharacterized protein
MKRGRPRYPGLLTPREQQVLDLVRKGLSNEQIAERLGISLSGARYHVAEILSKLGVSSRQEAALWQPRPAAGAGRFGFVAALLRRIPAATLARAGGGLAVAAGVGVLLVLLLGVIEMNHREAAPAAAVEQAETPAAEKEMATPGPAAGLEGPLPRTPASLSPSAPSADYVALAFVDPTTGWLTGRRCPQPIRPATEGKVSEGVIAATSDGGLTWQEQYSGQLQPTDIAFVDATTGWAIGPLGSNCDSSACEYALIVTRDGGQHWSQAFKTDLRLQQIRLISDNDGWLLGLACPSASPGPDPCSGHVLSTRDGGGSWHDATLPSKAHAYDLSRPSRSDGFVMLTCSACESRLFVTHDSGLSWQSLPGPGADTGLTVEQEIFFLTPSQGWLLSGGQAGTGNQVKQVFATYDGGQTWQRIAGTGSPPNFDGSSGLMTGGYVGPMLFTSAQNGVITSPRGGILHSNDGGAHWSLRLKDGASGSATASFSDSQHGWAVLDNTLWRTADGGENWTQMPLP